jgi:phospholipase/carboxylesterase
MSALITRERPAAGDPAGLLVLHHGRGADEHDLLGLADVLDPDPDTFHASYALLSELHDELWERTGLGPEQTVLGGFSMGTVMSYALGLGPDRPAPAGILAFSGFVPTVAGWEPSLEDRAELRAFIAHGRRDPVIDVAFARRAAALLRAGGLDVTTRESDVGHQIDRSHLAAATDWLAATLGVRT